MPHIQQMMRKQMGCLAQVPSEGQLCMRHAPCRAEFQPCDPKACSPCHTSVATLLQKQHITCQELKFNTIHHHWSNFIKLASKHKRVASWADSDLPSMLGIGWTPLRLAISVSPVFASGPSQNGVSFPWVPTQQLQQAHHCCCLDLPPVTGASSCVCWQVCEGLRHCPPLLCPTQPPGSDFCCTQQLTACPPGLSASCHASCLYHRDYQTGDSCPSHHS